MVPWDDAQKDTFVRMRFEAQDAWYREHYAGRASTSSSPTASPSGASTSTAAEIRIVDIALLPEHRAKGIATALLAPILEEADDSRKSVTIHVERGNRARRLYERLGFVEVADHGVYALMERRPRPT